MYVRINLYWPLVEIFAHRQIDSRLLQVQYLSYTDVHPLLIMLHLIAKLYLNYSISSRGQNYEADVWVLEHVAEEWRYTN